MESGRTEKNVSNATKAVANHADGAGGQTMPAVPVLRKQEPGSDEPAQLEAAPVINREYATQQLKPFPAQPVNESENRQLQPFQLKTENKTGLPDNLKSGVEGLSGFSLNDVKVHYNSDKPAQLQALAFAQGTDIHVGPGQEKHLPHEAWHVVQQKQGRVQPTIQMKQGVPVNDDPGLEHEADVMGAKAIEASNTPPAQTKSDSRQKTAFVQLKVNEPAKLITSGTPLLSESIAGDNIDGISTVQTVQALMSLVEFRNSSTLGKSRKTIATIDTALADYHAFKVLHPALEFPLNADAEEDPRRAQELALLTTLKARVDAYILDKETNDPTNARIAPVKRLLDDIVYTQGYINRTLQNPDMIRGMIDNNPDMDGVSTLIARVSKAPSVKALVQDYFSKTATQKAITLGKLYTAQTLQFILDTAFIDGEGLVALRTFPKGKDLSADQKAIIDMFVERVTTVATMKELLSQRFDIPLADIKALEVDKPKAGDDKVTAETDWDLPGLQRAYGVLKTLPEGHASSNAKLKKLKRYSDTGGGWYGDGATIAVGYTDINTNIGGGRSVSDWWNNAGATVFKGKNSFDKTVRHEVGHAVDDAHNLSAGYCAGAAGGTWEKFDSASALVTDYYTKNPTDLSRHVRFNAWPKVIVSQLVTAAKTLDEVKDELRTYMAAAYGGNADHPDLVALVNGDVGLRSLGKEALKRPWQSSESPNVGGRTYVFSSADSLHSYATTARARQVSNYQFRAPAEFFAEAYAAYYTPDANGPGKGDKLREVDAATFNFIRDNVDKAL